MNNTIYTVLKDIFKTKEGKLHTKPDFSQALQNNYILQRWISMDSTENAYLVNETTNKIWSGLADDKELWYKLYLILINKKSYHKIGYIKRPSTVVNEKRKKLIDDESIKHQLSKREIETNIKLIEWFEQVESDKMKGNIAK